MLRFLNHNKEHTTNNLIRPHRQLPSQHTTNNLTRPQRQLLTTYNHSYLILPSTQVHVDPLHDVVLLRIIRLVLARYLQHCWNSFVVVLEDMPDGVGYVLVDEDYANVGAAG